MRVDTIHELEGLVMGLALASLAQMRDTRKGPHILPLYSGRVRYQREPIGREQWQTAFETSLHGSGDCEDLTAYRVAELWHTGEDREARPQVIAVTPTLRHVVVRRGNGAIEDPSKKLGMKGKA